MSDKFYLAQPVENLMKVASSLMHGFVDCIKDQQTEIKSLETKLEIAKAASTNKVSLEKVAKIDKADILDLVDTLESHGMIDSKKKGDYIEGCLSDPSFAVKVATKALKASESPSSQGYGIAPKAHGTAAKGSALEEQNMWFDAVS